MESNAASSHEPPPPPAVPGQTAALPPPPAATQAPAAVIAQRAPPARRALFNGPTHQTHHHHAPVRRTKSEGHVQGESAVPEVCTDATMNDRLWSKLEDPHPGGSSSHRDSVSSSSSISSNDTVIDLSLPNLVRKGMGGSVGGGEAPWSRPRSALVSYDAPRAVSKSKSNPNLRQGQSPPPEEDDELRSRPLGAQPHRGGGGEDASPSRTAQRRHTWSRLYMEGLKQASNSSSPRRGPSVSSVAASPSPSSSMSKSLGDLTSDDIACNFDSKYRSISRSFIVRPTREQQLRRGSPRSLSAQQQHQRSACSDLTEQLRRLTDVEPLTASDFSSSSSSSSPRTTQGEQEEEEAVMDEPPLRRTSSRSQSRVRYIANRAKQAQERQRLQMGLHLMACQRNANGSIAIGGGGSGSGSPIEERGIPEGACCVARSPCSSLDLLSQLAPQSVGSPSSPHHHHHHHQQLQSQSSPDPENNEVFFMLKL